MCTAGMALVELCLHWNWHPTHIACTHTSSHGAESWNPHITHTLAPVAALQLVGAPSGCPPHLSSSTLSRFFAVSPVKTGVHSIFLALLHWACTCTTHPLHPLPGATTHAPVHLFQSDNNQFLLILIDFVVPITFWAYHPPISSPPPVI